MRKLIFFSFVCSSIFFSLSLSLSLSLSWRWSRCSFFFLYVIHFFFFFSSDTLRPISFLVPCLGKKKSFDVFLIITIRPNVDDGKQYCCQLIFIIFFLVVVIINVNVIIVFFIFFLYVWDVRSFIIYSSVSTNIVCQIINKK
jgi:hypothetical protein